MLSNNVSNKITKAAEEIGKSLDLSIEQKEVLCKNLKKIFEEEEQYIKTEIASEIKKLKSSLKNSLK
ncbi:hypothetical protein [Fusobacterium polymorphum]|uniref:hypothetical protein n=1 Tax=Fusobacterium nucleatum subsp. polymorphum TaxID=76857 RepID=UPI00300BF97F